VISYKDVKAGVLARILRREWPPGALLPTEEELAQEYGCARATTNRALRELARTGIIERRRRAGTRVALRRPAAAMLTVPLVRVEIEEAGGVYGYALIERRETRADAALADRFGVRAGARLLHVRCLHLADGTPHQFETRWISLDAAPRAAAQGFETVSPNEWLVNEAPYTRLEHAFSAAAADAEERARLALAPGEPVFVIERRTWHAERAITCARLSHPATRYRLVSQSDWGG
jgi:GntR family histidine utilization transcriptional repressor